MQTPLNCIYDISQRQAERRGTQGFSTAAAYLQAAKLLLAKKRIFLVTGFCIASCQVGENDGPLGTMALAKVLELLGKEVIVISDKYSQDMLLTLKEYLKINGSLLIRQREEPEAEFTNLFKSPDDDLLLAIERPGRNIEGNVFSMSGEEISDFCPDTDFLFWQAKEKGVCTICLGDGGNEVGMGQAKSKILKQVPLGSTIAAEFPADILLTAGVSNWGAWSLIAVLSLFEEKNLLHDLNTETQMMALLMEAGAVDGVVKKPAMSVDGYSLQENLAVLKDLHTCVSTYLKSM